MAIQKPGNNDSYVHTHVPSEYLQKQTSESSEKSPAKHTNGEISSDSREGSNSSQNETNQKQITNNTHTSLPALSSSSTSSSSSVLSPPSSSSSPSFLPSSLRTTESSSPPLLTTSAAHSAAVEERLWTKMNGQENVETCYINTHGHIIGSVQSKNGEKEHFHHEEHHINQKISNRHKILTSFIAGGLAGAIAKTTIAPLDRTKINFQISEMKFSFRKAMQFLVKTYQTEGTMALWRGNSATMVRIVPYAAVQYTAHEQYKILLNRDKQRKHLPPHLRALAGSLAGITATSLTYPLDFARARMAVTARDRYRSIVIVFKTVLREEGWRVIMRGYAPTVSGSCIYSGVSFFLYETQKKVHAEDLVDSLSSFLWTSSEQADTEIASFLFEYSRKNYDFIRTIILLKAHIFGEYHKGRDPNPFERWYFGALAGLCGQCSSYPLDIVRRRMQTAGVTGHSKDYTSIYRTAKSVYLMEGLKGGLYKGLSMNWIKGPISAGISFMVFETVQRWLRKWPVFHVDGE